MHVLSKFDDSSLSKTKDTTICWSRDFVMMWPPFKDKWSMDSFKKLDSFQKLYPLSECDDFSLPITGDAKTSQTHVPIL